MFSECAGNDAITGNDAINRIDLGLANGSCRLKWDYGYT